MPSWWANQPISLFGDLAFFNRDNSDCTCAVGRLIRGFKVNSHEFHCNGLVKNPIFTARAASASELNLPAPSFAASPRKPAAV